MQQTADPFLLRRLSSVFNHCRRKQRRYCYKRHSGERNCFFHTVKPSFHTVKKRRFRSVKTAPAAIAAFKEVFKKA